MNHDIDQARLGDLDVRSGMRRGVPGSSGAVEHTAAGSRRPLPETATGFDPTTGRFAGRSLGDDRVLGAASRFGGGHVERAAGDGGNAAFGASSAQSGRGTFAGTLDTAGDEQPAVSTPPERGAREYRASVGVLGRPPELTPE